MADFGTIVQIRGYSTIKEDLGDLDTVMWNPIHFAVYQGHLPFLNYLNSNLKINVGITAPKNSAKDEGEQVND